GAARVPVATAIAVPVADWTGFYAGAHVGYGFSGRFNNNSGLDLGGASGVFGGLQAGYDWQFNSLLIGLAADISIADIKKTVPVFGNPLTAKA
ncbi:hypothetical protein, partial [Escherichia coli]|uniref:hypothetical protein n=1 Tax=Escherichia coli TaxID=562 RepID=UPI001952F70C